VEGKAEPEEARQESLVCDAGRTKDNFDRSYGDEGEISEALKKRTRTRQRSHRAGGV